MKRSETTAIWNKVFEIDDPQIRSRLLHRLLSANSKDVLMLALSGRHRYDAGGSEYLFAKSRKENALLDVIEIGVSGLGKQRKLYGIQIYSEMRFECVPSGMLFKTCAAGGTRGPIAGTDKYFRGSLKPNQYVPELANSIPRLASYISWGFKKRCYWTVEDALKDFKDWLEELQSQDSNVRKNALVAARRFNESDFCDDARKAIVDEAQCPLLAAIADSDPQIRRGAADILRSLEVSGDEVATIVACNIASEDAGIRQTALQETFWMTTDPDTMVWAICRGLSDSNRGVRRWGCGAIGNYGNRLNTRHEKKILEAVRRRMLVEEDADVLAALVQWFVGKLPRTTSSIEELCRIVRNASQPTLGTLAIVRLGKIGKNNPEAIRTVLENFETFPLHASEALVDMKCYSPAAKRKMSKLFESRDWSLRWRAVLYFENCPQISRAMGKSLMACLKDKEFTVREAAQRAIKKLKRNGTL